MRSSDNTSPPWIGTVAPVVLVPRPRATIGTPNSWQARTMSATCAWLVAWATASGGACLRELS